MNRNVRIAKELIRIAKDLMDVNISVKPDGKSDYSINYDELDKSDNKKTDNQDNHRKVAQHSDEYEHFTGDINWGQSKASVKNATFILRYGSDDARPPCVEFYDGTWENGTFYGDWDGGTWKNGTWIGGAWRCCENDGIWENGTWKDGWWVDGTWKGGTWEDGTWEKGTWKDGTWKKGTWKGGKDKDGKFHPKGDSPDKW